MALKRLTDISTSTGVTLLDFIHIVNTGDTSQYPSGSSYKATLQQVADSFSGLFTFTGNTSGDCITDLFVSDVNSCSPLHIQNKSNGNVLIGENGGVNVGIGTSTPSYRVHIMAADASNPALLVRDNTNTFDIASINGDGYTTVRGFNIGTSVNTYATSNYTTLNGTATIQQYNKNLYFTTTDSALENLLIYSDGSAKVRSNLFVGNVVDTTSRIYVRGADNTSSNYGLKVQNSGGTNTLQVRNDGLVDGYGNNISGKNNFKLGDDNNIIGGSGLTVGRDDFNSVLNIYGVNYPTLRFTANAYSSYILLQSAYNGQHLTLSNNSQSNFTWLSPTNIGINFPATAYTIDSTLKVMGSDSSTGFGLKVQNSGGTDNFVVRNGGNVGIGTSTPTSKLDIRGQLISGNGSGSTSTNDSPFYAVRPNLGNPNYYGGWQYVFEAGGGIWGIGMNYPNNEFQFLTNGGSTAKFVFGDGNPNTPNSKFIMDLVSGYFGANTIPTATIHGKGIDNTSSNYVLKVENSGSTSLLQVVNNGSLQVGKAYNSGFNNTNFIDFVSPNAVSVQQRFSIGFDSKVYVNIDPSNTITGGILHLGSQTFQYYNTAVISRVEVNCHDTTKNIGWIWDNPTGSTHLLSLITTDGSQRKFTLDQSTGNVGIGTGHQKAPSAKLQIEGIDSSSSGYGLKVQNGGGTDNFVVRNDGNVGIGTSTPTEKLEVSGKTKTTTLQVTSNPTDGYVLTSDGSGNATWQQPQDSTALGTGLTIHFSGKTVFNLPSSPASGNISGDTTNAKLGMIQKIYHQDSVEPTFPVTWKLVGEGVYFTNELNIIYAEYVEPTWIEYWIIQLQ